MKKNDFNRVSLRYIDWLQRLCFWNLGRIIESKDKCYYECFWLLMQIKDTSKIWWKCDSVI
jgi:hypothetical protein